VRTNLIRSYGAAAVEHKFTQVDQHMYDQMKVLKAQGFSTRKIAAKIGIGKSTAARYLKRSGESVLLPSVGTHSTQIGKVDQPMIEKMKVLRNRGFSLTKIASTLGLCRPTVKNHLKSYIPSIAILHPRTKVTTAMIAEMKMLRNQRLSYESIGAKQEVSAKTAWQHLKSYKPLEAY